MSRRPIMAMTSDWHLQRGAWKRANTPQGDAVQALRFICKFCADRELDLLGAGDLFDDLQPDTVTLAEAFAAASEMRRAGRRVLFTQGQHERAYPPYLSLHPVPEHAHRRTVTVRGVAVYGMDWVPADRLEEEAGRVPAGADVLMCHQVWAEFMGVGAEGSLALLNRPGGPGVVLTGDFHEHRALDSGGTRVYSPGSTCLQSADEVREKAFFVLHDDLSVESVPIPSRPVRDAAVRTPEDLEYLLTEIDGLVEPDDALPPDIRKPVLCVRAAAVDQAYARVARAVGGRAFLFWKPAVVEAADVVYDDAAAAAAAPRGMEACLPLVTPEGGPVYNGVLRLLRAADPKADLAAMAAEFGR